MEGCECQRGRTGQCQKQIGRVPDQIWWNWAYEVLFDVWSGVVYLDV